MPILNFKEIPEAHIASGSQDEFEMFARDFLELMGYSIISNPDRGADGGIDIIAEEIRVGVGGRSYVRWLVSCKHKAHSGASVKPADESNIRDRVEANECAGFIGIYSTLPSSGLAKIIAGLGGKIETQVFDKERIEGKLLDTSKGVELAKRYFPRSIANWQGLGLSLITIKEATSYNLSQFSQYSYIAERRYNELKVALMENNNANVKEAVNNLVLYLDTNIQEIITRNIFFMQNYFRGRSKEEPRISVRISTIHQSIPAYSFDTKSKSDTNIGVSEVLNTGIYFLSNDVSKMQLKQNQTENKNYNKKSSFGSLLIVPISMSNNLISDEFRAYFNLDLGRYSSLLGLISIDHIEREYFNEDTDVGIGYIFSEFLLLNIILYKKYTENSATYARAINICGFE